MNLKRIPALLLTLLILMSVITVPVFADGNVAKIGDTEYATLASAIAAVPTTKAETTVTLLDNTEISSAITVLPSHNVILDLNGKTLSSSAIANLIINKGTLTVKNGTVTSTATSTLADSGVIRVQKGNLTLDGVTVNAKNKGIYINGSSPISGTANVTIKNSTITSECGIVNGGAVCLNCGEFLTTVTVNIEKSTLTVTNTGSLENCGCVTSVSSTGSTVNISNSSLNFDKKSYAVYNYTGTVNIDSSTSTYIDNECKTLYGKMTFNQKKYYNSSSVNTDVVNSFNVTSTTDGTITCYYEGVVNYLNGFHQFTPSKDLAFGTRIFIAVEPNDGYNFESLTVGSAVYTKADMTDTKTEGITRYKDSDSKSTLLTDDPVSGFMITMPASETTITASFSEITYFKNTTTGKEYSKIETAISEAAAGETVKMLDDVTLDTYPELTNTTSGVTFDLDGHTLSVSEGYTLNTLNEAHKCIDSYSNFYAIGLKGNITVKNGTITTPCAYTFQTQPNESVNSNIVLEDITTNGGLNFNKTTATVTNVTADASKKYFYAIYMGGSGSKITVNSGYYKAGENKKCLYLDNDDTTGDQLVIWGGTFEGNIEANETCFYVPGTSNPSSIHIYKGIFNGAPESNPDNDEVFDYVDEKSITYVETKGTETDKEHWWTVDWLYDGAKVVNKIVYSSLTLVDDVSINYLFPNGDDGFTDYDIGLLTVSVDGENVELEECTEGWKIKKAKSFAPAEIGNTTILKIQITGTDVYKEYTYSVLKYCVTVCTAAENTYDSKLVTLCRTLVHYGNECQKALPNAKTGNTILSGYCKSVVYDDIPETPVSYKGADDIITDPTAVLTLTGKVGISVSFKAAENAEITVDGKKQNAVRNSNGIYTVTIPEKIAPYALDMEHHIKVTVDGKSQIMQLSPVTCMYYLSVNSSVEEEQNLAKAFYAYHIAAKEYKAVSNS